MRTNGEQCEVPLTGGTLNSVHQALMTPKLPKEMPDASGTAICNHTALGLSAVTPQGAVHSDILPASANESADIDALPARSGECKLTWEVRLAIAAQIHTVSLP